MKFWCNTKQMSELISSGMIWFLKNSHKGSTILALSNIVLPGCSFPFFSIGFSAAQQMSLVALLYTAEALTPSILKIQYNIQTFHKKNANITSIPTQKNSPNTLLANTMKKITWNTMKVPFASPYFQFLVEIFFKKFSRFFPHKYWKIGYKSTLPMGVLVRTTPK